MTYEETFVLIVGAGPVGLTLALELGRQAVPVIVISENQTTSSHPKCNYINIRSMEHFRRLGVADDIKAHASKDAFPLKLAYRTQYCGYEILSKDIANAGGADWLSSETAQTISQIALEPLLTDHVERLPSATVRLGWSVIALTAHGDGTDVAMRNLLTGEQRVIRARYVAGCDGADSFIRQAIGASLVGKDGAVQRNFLSPAKISYFLESEQLQAASGHSPAAYTWIINNDARGLIMSQDGGDRYIVHYQLSSDVDWKTVDADTVLKRMIGDDIDYKILSCAPWAGGIAKVADRYMLGNAFIVGDAAHHFTPFGGFGMNTGIGDAANLGWKLAAMYAGWGGDGLLESYAVERQEVGIRNSLIGIHSSNIKEKWTISATLEDGTAEAAQARADFGELIDQDIVESGEADFLMAGAQLGEKYASAVILGAPVVPEDDPWDRYTPSDGAGSRLPHAVLTDGSYLYDALAGDGFTLIVFNATDVSSFVDGARRKDVAIKVLRITDRLPFYSRNFLLVRPDQHIAWSGDALSVDDLDVVDWARGVDA